MKKKADPVPMHAVMVLALLSASEALHTLPTPRASRLVGHRRAAATCCTPPPSSALTVPKLKAALGEKGLSDKGKKAELVERLLQSL